MPGTECMAAVLGWWRKARKMIFYLHKGKKIDVFFKFDQDIDIAGFFLVAF
jgi:hypothetical protein